MLPVALCLIALAVLLFAEYSTSPRLQAVAKLTASSAFVWAAIHWGALETAFGALVLLGLVLCWLGDALLLPAGQTLWFKLGIGAFLVGHLCYAMACLQVALDPVMIAAFGAIAGTGAFFILRWLGPHLPGEFVWPVRVYVGVISIMVTFAGAAGMTASLGDGIAAGNLALIVGAFGFALSDLSVARERFVSPGFINVAWGLPAYFLSQLAIAYASGHAGPSPIG